MNATRAQKNISAVNVEHPDLKKHPSFAEAKQLECILGPGDMLFIPAKFWHYVRSLSPAISVNFWYWLDILLYTMYVNMYILLYVD